MSNSLRPFFSVLIIICSLFVIVFFEMEVRRINYSILRKVRQYQTLLDRYNKNLMTYLEKTRGFRLDQLARSQLILDRAQTGQVILLIDGKIAIPQ